MAAKSSDNRNITRAVTLDSVGNVKASGWMVRFTRGGESYQSFFGDAKHGGQKKSLAAARLDRDKQEPKFERIRKTAERQRVAELLSPGKKKPRGVRYLTKRVERGVGKNKRTWTYLVAASHWLDETGKRHTASFSCDKYGKQKAYDMACAARATALKKRLKAMASH